MAKKVIDGRRYDTDTAREVGKSTCIDEAHRWIDTLYRKNTGEYFLHRWIGNGEQVFEEWLIPMKTNEAKDWAKENLTADECNRILESSEDNQTKRTVTFSLTEATIEKISQTAVRNGCSKSEVIERVMALIQL